MLVNMQMEVNNIDIMQRVGTFAIITWFVCSIYIIFWESQNIKDTLLRFLEEGRYPLVFSQSFLTEKHRNKSLEH